MGRPLRTDIAGGRYHVVNRGVDRSTIFRDDRDRIEFERLIGLAHERFGVVAHAYCWMSNHYHLLLDCPEGGLSDAMHLIGSVYVRHTNERHGRDGPLFADRFYARPVLSEAYLIRCVRYIHQNPTAMLSPGEPLETYRWSSLRAYLGHRPPPSWLRITDVLTWCGGREGLRRLCLDDPPMSLQRIAENEWMHAIELVIDGSEASSGLARAGRTVAALLLDRLDGPDRVTVSALLDYPSRDAEYAARSRARRQERRRPELTAIVDAAIRLAA